MKKFLIKNISYILLIFLYLQPIIDLSTSLILNYLKISISIGFIIRIVFLLFLVYFYIFVKRNFSKSKKIYLLIIALYIIGFSIMIISLKDIFVLSYELQNVLKIFYFPLLLTIISKDDLKLNYKDLVRIAFIYLMIIFVPSICKWSLNSYSQGKIGSVGWFNSGNEISAIISILTPFIIYYLFDKNSLYKKIFLIFLCLYCYFIMGSKIVIISLIISVIFNIILYLKNHKLEKKYYYMSIAFIIIILLLGFTLLPRTNFYNNVIIHLNYLGINNIKDIFSFNFLNRFIFSDRLTYLANTNLNYIFAKPVERLLGLGYIESYATDYVYIKAIEMDFFDIFFRTGIIGFMIFIIPVVINTKRIFKKSADLNIMKVLKFAVILALVISFLVGHTLVAPGVAIFIIYLILYLK